jgi:hypothetical protein
MDNLETKKVINIKGDNFTFDITKLSVQDFVAIEAEKQFLTSNQYAKIASSYLPDSFNAATLIDLIAICRVMNPKIEESLETKNFFKLNLFDTKDLLDIYKKEIGPWYRAWMNKFSDPFEENDDKVGDEK